MARPSKFDQKLLDGICERLAEGVPLTQICRDLELQGTKLAPRTVRDWEAQRPEVSAAIARARAFGEEALAEECLAIADDSRNDWMDRAAENGDEIAMQFNGEHVQRSKLRIETRLKLLAKFNPKRWGDKVQQEITGANGGPIETLTSVKLVPLE